MKNCILLLSVSVIFSSRILAQSNFEKIYPAQNWKLTRNPHPEINILLDGTGQFAGDINGDGRNDLVFAGFSGDERTENPGDNTGKSFVYFGGNFTAAYDQLVYRFLTPLGDMNGDGFDDALADDGKGKYEFYLGSKPGYVSRGEPAPRPDYNLIGFADLDGDGFEDFVTYPRGLTKSYYKIVWGATQLGTAQIKHFAFTDSVDFNLRFADVDGDGKAEMVVMMGGDGKPEKIEIFSFDAGRTPSLRQRIVVTPASALPPHLRNLFLIDIDGDGFKEILLQSNSKNNVFVRDKQVGQFYNPSPLMIFDGYLAPLGDLDGDHRFDFYTNDSSRPLVFGISDLSLGLGQERGNFPTKAGESINQAFYNPYGTYGDLDGDQIADAVFSTDSGTLYGATESFGRKIIHGNASRVFQTTQVSYSRRNFFDRITATSNLGDLNGDGIDELAMIFSDRAEVGIFYGRSPISHEPDLILVTGSLATYPENAVGGDFNNDGHRDVVVSFGQDHHNSRLEFYFGGNNMDGLPDHTITAREVLPEDREGATIGPIINAGDLNHDGIDDLVFNVFTANDVAPLVNKIAYVYGKTHLTNLPDGTITYSDFGLGYFMEALGDVNGDGIDDFMVSNYNARNNDDSRGNAWLYFGKVDSNGNYPKFDAPDLILRPRSQEATKRLQYFSFGLAGNGDFNGDGYNDFAIKALFAYKEVPAIYIYYGGPQIDDQPDAFLLAPPEAFGHADDSIWQKTRVAQLAGLRLGGLLKFIPDIDNDGVDELLLTSGPSNTPADYVLSLTNAALYRGGQAAMIPPNAVLVALNQNTSLGCDLFQANVAVGDFNNDKQTDIILTQVDDNNDAAHSSRVYRYSISSTTSVTDREQSPHQLALRQNYPNPFNPSTTITFDLPNPSQVRLEIYDLQGRRVTTLVNSSMKAGTHTVAFDAAALTSGVYLYRLTTEQNQITRKMVFLE